MMTSARSLRAFLAYGLIVVIATAGDGQQVEKDAPPASLPQVGPLGVFRKAQDIPEAPVTPSQHQQKKKEAAERLDKEKLLYTARVVVDEDPKMLVIPECVAKYSDKFSVAKTPPKVEFAIVPVQPLFPGDQPPSRSKIPNKGALWANWSQGIFDRRTSKFYSSVGDHVGYNAHLYLVEYDPTAKKVKCLPEVNKMIGRAKTQFGDGKIHGWLSFYQSQHLKTPHLWFCTYWCKYDEPDEDDFATGYDGGHIVSCDVATGDMVDYGAPLIRASWPYHALDARRGMLYAAGMFGEFLAWDINEQRSKWAGYTPPGMVWNNRAILVDEESGMVFTSNNDKSDPERHFLKYDPVKNRFSRLACHVPEDRETTERGKAGEHSPLRAHSRHRGVDGLFWCVTAHGELFTFDPVKEEIADKGMNWPGEQKYTCSMERSPKGRYVYYLPGAHGRGYAEGSPLIQYDTRTGALKILAFMFPYYYEKYGYTPGGTFSISLDDKGERLFILWNGAFSDYDPKKSSDTFGQCAIMLVHIPETERVE